MADTPASRARAARLASGELAELPAQTRERLPWLLEAMVAIGAGTELRSTLDQIVRTAAQVAQCRYAAIGVLAESGDEERVGQGHEHPGGLREFITHGVPTEIAERIGHPPDGRHGLLAAVLREDRPLRLTDLTADPRFEGWPPHHPPMHSFLGNPVTVGDELFGNLYLAEKRNGEPFDDNDVLMIKILATEAGIAIGHARLQEKARLRERWIDGSTAVATALLAGDEDALTVVAEQARRLAESEAALVLLPEDDGATQRVAAATAPHADALLGTPLPRSGPVWDEVTSGRPVLIEDATHDPRLREPLDRFGPCMLLPLTSGERMLGTLAVPRAPGAARFTEAETSMAARFAGQAALALAHAEAQRDRERLAVLEDRDRIARDLHDLVIQRLFATGMTLQGARRHLGASEQAREETDERPHPHTTAADRIEEAVDELDATIAEIRTTIFALRQDLGEAQPGLRARALRETGLAAVPLGFSPSVTFSGPVDTVVGEAVGKNLVAALREALSNAFRHARATRIEVHVDATAHLPDGRAAVRLTVADDGIGIPASGRRSGLANIARRAENLGGESSWGAGLSADGGGTTVVWTAPLHEE